MKNITMTELADLGFEVVKSYTYDVWLTQRRQKGCIQVETTWEMPSGKFEKQELWIEAEWVEGFNADDLKKLDEILNKTK